MDWIHARRPLAVGAFLIVSVMGMAEARYTTQHESRTPVGASDPCAGDCGIDFELTCGSTEHVMDTDGPMLDQASPHGTHSGCKPEKCAWEGGPASIHPECNESLNLVKSGDYERLKAAIAAEDDQSVQKLMHRYPKMLALNTSRASIMVLACNQTPRANLPLHVDQFERLVDAQQ